MHLKKDYVLFLLFVFWITIWTVVIDYFRNDEVFVLSNIAGTTLFSVFTIILLSKADIFGYEVKKRNIIQNDML